MKKLLMLVSALFFVTACTTTDNVKKDSFKPDWYHYVDEKGGYSVQMPHAPRTFSRTVSSAVGDLTFYFAILDEKGDAYMCSYNDYPDGVLKGQNLQVMLKGAKMGAAKKIQGDVVFEKMITIDGHPGIEFEVSAPQRKIRYFSRAYIVKNRLYQIVYVSEGKEAALKKRDYLFKTFALR